MEEKGLFIVVEGIDGSGKTTQIEVLKKHFFDSGIEAVVTREPGGTAIGEKIRDIILDSNNRAMSDLTEMFLYAASRAQHAGELIAPKVRDGVTVISDRYVLSSYVYQGIARGIDLDIVRKVNDIAMQSVLPDITFFINIDNEESFRRRAIRNSTDRIEEEQKDFHIKVMDGYREMIKHIVNVKVINGMQSVENVSRDMIDYINEIKNKK